MTCDKSELPNAQCVAGIRESLIDSNRPIRTDFVDIARVDLVTDEPDRAIAHQEVGASRCADCRIPMPRHRRTYRGKAWRWN